MIKRKVKVYDTHNHTTKVYDTVKDCAKDLGYTSAQIIVGIRVGVTSRSGLYGMELSYCD